MAVVCLLLARDAQAKLALIVAHCLSICVSICVSVRDSLSHAYVRSIARREPRRLPACTIVFYVKFRSGLPATVIKRILHCIVLYVCMYVYLRVCLSVSWVLSGLAAAVSVLDSGRLYPRAPGDGAGL